MYSYRLLRWAPAPLLLLLLSGCSGKPSASDMQRDLNNAFQACTAVMSITNFQKDNGQDIDATHYEATVEADLTLTSVVDQSYLNTPIFPCLEGAFANAAQPLAINPDGTYSAGQTRHAKFTLDYVKTDNGWVLAQNAGN